MLVCWRGRVRSTEADPATAVPDSAVGAADLGIGIKAGIATTDGGRLLLGNKEYRVLSGASATQAEYARLATAPGAPPPLVLSLREATATGVVRAIDERLRTLLARKRWYGTKRLRNRAFTVRLQRWAETRRKRVRTGLAGCPWGVYEHRAQSRQVGQEGRIGARWRSRTVGPTPRRAGGGGGDLCDERAPD